MKEKKYCYKCRWKNPSKDKKSEFMKNHYFCPIHKIHVHKHGSCADYYLDKSIGEKNECM